MQADHGLLRQRDHQLPLSIEMTMGELAVIAIAVIVGAAGHRAFVQQELLQSLMPLPSIRSGEVLRLLLWQVQPLASAGCAT
jgi:hypothetical protein